MNDNFTSSNLDNYNKYIDYLGDYYSTFLTEGSISKENLTKLFEEALNLQLSESPPQKMDSAKNLKKLTNEFVNNVALAYLNQNLKSNYDDQIAKEVVSHILNSTQNVKELVFDSLIYQKALKGADDLNHFYEVASHIQNENILKIYLALKKNFFEDILKHSFTEDKQLIFLQGIEQFFKELDSQPNNQKTLSYLNHHLDWISMRLHDLFLIESHLSPHKVKQALHLLCDRPPLSSKLESSLTPVMPKEFENALEELFNDKEIIQAWKHHHISSLMKYYNHYAYYSKELNTYFIRYQGEYTILTEVINQIQKEFKQGNKNLYYLDQGLIHYDPEKSTEVLPLLVREAATDQDSKYKLTLVSVGAKEKGLSDPGHGWIRLEEPFKQDGKDYVRVYSIGFFLRGRFIIPDKFEFTPRQRLETSFEISQEEFTKTLDMVQYFRLYSLNKTSIKGSLAEKFNDWIKGDCVEFVVERAIESNIQLPENLEKDKGVARMIAHKKQKPPPSNKTPISQNYQGPQLTDRLRLPFQALLYGDPRVLRKWQEQLIAAKIPLQAQFTSEKPLSDLSIL